MSAARNTNIVACFLILRKGDHILLSKRSSTGYHDGEYSVISGHVEAEETFTNAIIREAKEEANIILTSSNLQVKHVMHRKSDVDQSERVDVYFVADNWRGQPLNNEPNKCSEIGWFNINNLPSNILPCVKSAIENMLQNIYYSEHGWTQPSTLSA